MRFLAITLLCVATGCQAQETSSITSKVFEPDFDKDGKPDLRFEAVYRDGTKALIVQSKPDAQGVLKVTSRAFYAGGEMVSTESDEDRDGVFERLAVYRPGTSEMEAFTRQPDGSGIPVSEKTLAAYKKQIAALEVFFDKAFEEGTDTDEATMLMEETRRRIRTAEEEKSNGNQ